MALKIHHLNCATMCPVGGGRFDLTPPVLPCHCLLIESPGGLILIDTGIGLQDVRAPKSRLGNFFLFLSHPHLKEEETALRQVEKMGFSAHDVRHVIVTHLDVDHAGGLGDFPNAQVHVHEAEWKNAVTPSSFFLKHRYRASQWAHGPNWNVYNEDRDGENWFGFSKVTQLKGLPPEILMIPLKGHSPGHCGIAVAQSTGWLLHAGDAYFSRQEMDATCPKCPAGLLAFQKILATDYGACVENKKRLRQLAQNEIGKVKIFCSHDFGELESIRIGMANK